MKLWAGMSSKRKAGVSCGSRSRRGTPRPRSSKKLKLPAKQESPHALALHRRARQIDHLLEPAVVADFDRRYLIDRNSTADDDAEVRARHLIFEIGLGAGGRALTRRLDRKAEPDALVHVEALEQRHPRHDGNLEIVDVRLVVVDLGVLLNVVGADLQSDRLRDGHRSEDAREQARCKLDGLSGAGGRHVRYVEADFNTAAGFDRGLRPHGCHGANGDGQGDHTNTGRAHRSSLHVLAEVSRRKLYHRVEYTE